MFIRKHFKQALFGDMDGGSGAGSDDSGNDGGNIDGAGAGDAGASGAGDGGEPPQISFPDGLDDDIKNDPSLKVFIGEDNKINYGNMMKSYVHAQRQMGKKGIIPPDQNSSEEDWNNFYNAIGRPDLEKYEINPGEGDVDEEFFKGFKEEAHKAGLLPGQAQTLLNWYNEKAKGIQDSQQAQFRENYEAEVASLEKEWGEGFDKNKQLADQALKHFVDGDLLAKFNEEGLGNSVTMVKVFNKIGQALMTEDDFSHESKGSFGMTPEEAQAKINSYMADPNGPYLNGDHVDHSRAVAEVQKLSQILYR